MRPPIDSRSTGGIAPFASMVRYEMHLVASSTRASTKSICGTRVQTASATAASIRFERLISHEIEIEHQNADEEERPDAWINEVRVVSEPPETGAAREIALE